MIITVPVKIFTTADLEESKVFGSIEFAKKYGGILCSNEVINRLRKMDEFLDNQSTKISLVA